MLHPEALWLRGHVGGGEPFIRSPTALTDHINMRLSRMVHSGSKLAVHARGACFGLLLGTRLEAAAVEWLLPNPRAPNSVQ